MRLPRSKALTTLAGVLIAVFALAGCSSAPASAPSAPAGTAGAPVTAETIAAAHGLAGLDARAIIDRLEATPVAERSKALMASVRPDGLRLIDGTGEASLPMPDEFYLSVAPYADNTHECFFHSLTTCLGELRNADISVKVTDAAGAVLVDEDLRTSDNGFVGLWLPIGIEGTLTIEHDGLSATTPIATGPDDPTCLTTMQLA